MIWSDWIIGWVVAPGDMWRIMRTKRRIRKLKKETAYWNARAAALRATAAGRALVEER